MPATHQSQDGENNCVFLFFFGEGGGGVRLQGGRKTFCLGLLPRVRASLWMLSPFLLSVLHFWGSDHSLVKDEPEPAAP